MTVTSEQWVTRIREVLEGQQSLSTNELLDSIKLNLYSKEVFVFTPKGEIKLLPSDLQLWILLSLFIPI